MDENEGKGGSAGGTMCDDAPRVQVRYRKMATGSLHYVRASVYVPLTWPEEEGLSARTENAMVGSLIVETRGWDAVKARLERGGAEVLPFEEGA